MRYFYRAAHFKESQFQQKIGGKINELQKKQLDFIKGENYTALHLSGKLIDTLRGMKERAIPKEFDLMGHDKRTWTHTNEFIEINKESYEEIVELESGIMEDVGVKLAKLKGWHCPVKVHGNVKDVEEYLKNKFNIESAVIIKR
jgi:hypothetical protein